MADPQPTVFVIDDDPSLRRGVERLLRTEGYEVECFDSAAAYFARAAHAGPGCLLVDLAMPGMDGLEMQARLAQDARSLPIVFLSGHADIPASVRAMKMGAVDFLTKPVDAGVLLPALRAALARHAGERMRRAEQTRREARLARLTDREHEVLHFVVAGLRNKVIAARLGITEKTVKAHRAHIMEKTGATSLPDLVRLAAGGPPGATDAG